MASENQAGADKAFVSYTNAKQEYFFREGCFIIELSNSTRDPSLSIARVRVEPGASTRWHRLHGVSERYVILSGNGRVEVGDRLVEFVTAGDVVVIPPNTRQRIANRGESDLIFLALCTPRFTETVYEDLEAELADQPPPDTP